MGNKKIMRLMTYPFGCCGKSQTSSLLDRLIAAKITINLESFLMSRFLFPSDQLQIILKNSCQLEPLLPQHS